MLLRWSPAWLGDSVSGIHMSVSGHPYWRLPAPSDTYSVLQKSPSGICLTTIRKKNTIPCSNISFAKQCHGTTKQDSVLLDNMHWKMWGRFIEHVFATETWLVSIPWPEWWVSLFPLSSGSAPTRSGPAQLYSGTSQHATPPAHDSACHLGKESGAKTTLTSCMCNHLTKPNLKTNSMGVPINVYICI